MTDTLVVAEKVCTNPDCTVRRPQPLDAFHINRKASDGHLSQCQACQHAANAACTAAKRGVLADIKAASGCVVCGKTGPRRLLHFHHLPAAVKLFNIGNSNRSLAASWRKPLNASSSASRATGGDTPRERMS